MSCRDARLTTNLLLLEHAVLAEDVQQAEGRHHQVTDGAVLRGS